MDLLHNIETNGGGKDRGERERGRSLCKDAVRSPSPALVYMVIYAPPDVERTLTVGREAILEDSLEDSLDGADGLDDCVDWKNKVYQFYSLPTNRAKQTRPRASNALDGRQGRRVCTYNQPPRKGSIMAAPTPFRGFMLSFIPILPST